MAPMMPATRCAGCHSPLSVAADVEPDVTVKALSGAFDDLRRLGEVELRLVYPEIARRKSSE